MTEVEAFLDEWRAAVRPGERATYRNFWYLHGCTVNKVIDDWMGNGRAYAVAVDVTCIDPYVDLQSDNTIVLAEDLFPPFHPWFFGTIIIDLPDPPRRRRTGRRRAKTAGVSSGAPVEFGEHELPVAERLRARQPPGYNTIEYVQQEYARLRKRARAPKQA